MIALLAGCDSGKISGPDGDGNGGGGDVAGEDVGQYLSNMNYDADRLLNVQPRDSSRTAQGQQELPPERVGNDMRVCTRTTYGLQTNLTEVAILRPTQGVVWPGALVKANGTLMDGTPEPFTLARAPMVLSIDLPGITDQGRIVVDRPSNSSTQAAVNEALEWWNANQYEEGYVNAAQTSFRLTTSYSYEQTAIDIGLGAGWASGTADALLSQTTTEEKRSLTAVYKQAFYNVTMDTPAAPEAVFDQSVSLADVERSMTAEAPPAYVATVTYGKIIMAKMETTLQTSRRAAEAAFRYAMSATAYVEGSLDAEEKKALAESSIEIVVLGGNAATATEVIAGTPAEVVEGIQRVIRGENAVYSRSNPGVPIAYTVRYLRDNSLAKLGYTTEYTATECQVNRAFASVNVHLDRFFVSKDCDGIEGAGDFKFLAEVTSRQGRHGSWQKGGLSIDDGGSAVINQEYRFDVPLSAGSYFKVRAVGEEWDKPVIGAAYLDSRMKGDAAEKVYAYQSDGTFSNYAPGQLIKLDLGTSASECRAQLWYTVRDIR